MTEAAATTIHAIIANPHAFDGKGVRVIGYGLSQGEVWGIFSSESACRTGPAKKGIWLETYDMPYAEVNEAYAIAEGTRTRRRAVT